MLCSVTSTRHCNHFKKYKRSREVDQARSGDTGDHYWDRCKRNAGNHYFKKKPAEHFKDNPDQLNYSYNFTKIEFPFNGVGAQARESSWTSNDGTKFSCHRAMLGTKSKVMIEANMREKKESILKLGYRREIAKVFVDSFSNEEIDKTLIAQEIENFLDLAEC